MDVKHGSISVVWRQQTDTGQAVFFKAIPPLFGQKPPLTEWLSRRSPANVSRVRLAPLYHAGSYRRVFGIGTAAATEFAQTLPWLLGLLVEP